MPKKLSNPEVKEVVEIFRRQEAERQAFTERYGHAHPPQAVRMGGKVFMVHEGGIYSQIHEGPYNFVNAIHDHALHFFGIDYLEQEEVLSQSSILEVKTETGYQQFNDLQTLKLSKKQLCDRTEKMLSG